MRKLTVLPLLFLIACSSAPKVADLPQGTRTPQAVEDPEAHQSQSAQIMFANLRIKTLAPKRLSWEEYDQISSHRLVCYDSGKNKFTTTVGEQLYARHKHEFVMTVNWNCKQVPDKALDQLVQEAALKN